MSIHPLCFSCGAGFCASAPPLTFLAALAVRVFAGSVLADLVIRDFLVFVVFLAFTVPPFHFVELGRML